MNVSFKDGTVRVEKSKYLVDTKEDNLVAQLIEKEKKAFGTQSPFAVRSQSNLCLLNMCSYCIVRKCFLYRNKQVFFFVVIWSKTMKSEQT